MEISLYFKYNKLFDKSQGGKMSYDENYNSIKRGNGYHSFQGELIKAIKKEDSATFGMRLQNSSKYRSYKIKMKRRAKRK